MKFIKLNDEEKATLEDGWRSGLDIQPGRGIKAKLDTIADSQVTQI